MTAAGRRLRAPASLRAADGSLHFFPELELQVEDEDTVQPVEYEGRRFVFSHVVPAVGYSTGVEEDVYVFRESVGN